MLVPEDTWAALAGLNLGDWRPRLEPLVRERLAPGAHGNLPDWLAAIDALPAASELPARLDGDTVTTAQLGWSDQETVSASSLLKRLSPWRKGPFRIDTIDIDSEWRSDWKWRRVAAAVGSLDGLRVLDVGCGNGYYALRMRGSGARAVLGIDPTLLYLAQFAAVSRFMAPEPVHLLPLRLEELPLPAAVFDRAFSMGVLYHSRAPLDHLRQLRQLLKPEGRLVLETLVLPGNEALSRTPAGRYARMRNVWFLPTLPELENWLARTGFLDIRVADVTATTPDEQRQTEWMPFESLREALDPDDPGRTVEGWPAPLRALVLATNPA